MMKWSVLFRMGGPILHALTFDTWSEVKEAVDKMLLNKWVVSHITYMDFEHDLQISEQDYQNGIDKS